jgi:hypothetical protein
MLCRTVFGLALTALVSGAATASAATISLGSAIPLTGTTFALPVEITDAAALTAWQFDLHYDATDVQIDTACDPFVDAYCDFLTGPVSEGEFFSSGAPFNVLNPGIVVLDPATLMQSGVLLAAQGAYGGFPPAPSGDGVIAYIRFVGDVTSPITIQNPSTTSSVPEPASVLALGAALALLRLRQRHRRSVRP